MTGDWTLQALQDASQHWRHGAEDDSVGLVVSLLLADQGHVTECFLLVKPRQGGQNLLLESAGGEVRNCHLLVR